MISTVKITKTVEAMVAVEHPDDMDAASVLALVKERAFDLAPRVCWWEAREKTVPTEVFLGINEPDEPEHGGCCAPMRPEPFDLMSDDPTSEEN